MIVITGATGHIGNNFARLLHQKKIAYKVLLRNMSPAVADFQENCFFGNIFDVEFLKEVVHKDDVFVHFAAFIDLYDKNLDETMYVNDFGARIIFDYCSENQIRLIYSSTVDIIERTSSQAHIAEPVEIHPEIHTSNYGLTKANATKYLMNLMDSSLIDACIIYPTAVIGAHDYKPSRAGQEIHSALKRKLFFYVNGGYNFIDVEDIAYYCLEIIERNISGSYILGGHNVKVFDFYKLINRTLNKQALYIYVPKWLAYFFSKFSKMYSNIMLQAVFDNYHYDLSRVRHTFLHRQKSFEDTVESTLKWFVEHHQEKK